SAEGAHDKPTSSSLSANAVRISTFALLTAPVSVSELASAALSSSTRALSPRNSSGSMVHIKDAIARFLPPAASPYYHVACLGWRAAKQRNGVTQPDTLLRRPGREVLRRQSSWLIATIRLRRKVRERRNQLDTRLHATMRRLSFDCSESACGVARTPASRRSNRANVACRDASLDHSR